jgi:hypothetical protein
MCGLEGRDSDYGREKKRGKDVRRYADMEPVRANTVHAVWIVFKAVGLWLAEIATPRAHAFAASDATCTARMKTRRLRVLLLTI